jgi:hypothetical protein
MVFLHIALGYIVSAFVGDLIVDRAVNSLWRIAEASGDLASELRSLPSKLRSLRPPPRIRFWHGFMERTLYTSMIVFGKPEGIAVWLAFKAVMRWKVRENDEAHIPGSNIYMIGTALNVAIGVLGGFIAKWKFSF